MTSTYEISSPSLHFCFSPIRVSILLSILKFFLLFQILSSLFLITRPLDGQRSNCSIQLKGTDNEFGDDLSGFWFCYASQFSLLCFCVWMDAKCERDNVEMLKFVFFFFFTKRISLEGWVSVFESRNCSRTHT